MSTRLPHDTAALVQGFYDFPFDAWSDPGARRVTLDATKQRVAGVDDAVELLARGSLARLTLPTPDDGAPAADQAPGAEDVNGRGHAQHAAAWRWFEANGRAARAA